MPLIATQLTYPAEVGLFLYLNYALLNLMSGYLAACAHNAIYYMFGITTPLDALMANVVLVAGLVPIGKLFWPRIERMPMKDLLPIALCQLGIAFFQNNLHMQTKEGGLYALRSFDWVTTLTVIVITKYKFHEHQMKNKTIIIAMFVAITQSLCWVEPDIYYLEWVFLGLLSVPFLGVCQALLIVWMYEKGQKTNVGLENFIFNVALVTMLVEGIPCVALGYDTFTPTLLMHIHQFHNYDLMMIFGGVIFMSIHLYSKYWLHATCTPETYCMLRHTKFLAAAFGQWFIQEMQYATWYSGTARVFCTLALLAYWYKRFPDRKTLGA